MKKRIGKFYIDRHIYDDMECVYGLFKHLMFIPYRVEFHYDKNQFMLIGLSDLFSIVKEGELYPEYKVIITFEKDGYSYDIELIDK